MPEGRPPNKPRLVWRSYKRRALHELDRGLSRRIDISDVKTVCLMLGPYRNLTTLTASMIALHPSCQILNHAGERIFNDRHLDFFRDYNDEKFDNFIKYAIQISSKGRRGPHGGSITYSHAFDHGPMQEAYRSRYGDSLQKPNPNCLVWKEPLRVANHIRRYLVDLGEIFEKNDRLRFLAPVRNPLDCAASNLRVTQLVRLFEGIDESSSSEAVVDAILNELKWFLDLSERYPQRFFFYLENSFDESTVYALADFLQVTPDERWVQSILASYQVKSSYQHDDEILDHYRFFVKNRFSDYPEIEDKLLAFSFQNGASG